MKQAPILPWHEGLPKAAHILRTGGVVAIPTETYYGLAADPRNEVALLRIFAIKRRDESLQLPILGGHERDALRLGVSLPVPVQGFLRTGWPPAFSVILDAPPGFPTLFRDGVAFRVSSHPVASHLVRLFGFPVTATSANRHGEPPASIAQQCAHLEVDLVLDAGPTRGGRPSSLVRVRPDGGWEILREGATPPDSWNSPAPDPGWTRDKIPACDRFVFQPARDGYRFNLDSILLSDFALRCMPHPADFLDLGAGSGVCAFWLQAHFPQAVGCGLETDENACRAARTAAALQGLCRHLEFIHGDLAHEKSLLPGDAFDLVVSNPPYYAEGGRKSRTASLLRARHDDGAFLQGAFACARRVLHAAGVLALVLPARRLPEMLAAAADVKLEPFRLQMVHPRAGQPANRVLAAFVKARRHPLEILPPLVVHEENGYTPVLREILT